MSSFQKPSVTVAAKKFTRESPERTAESFRAELPEAGKPPAPEAAVPTRVSEATREVIAIGPLTALPEEYRPGAFEPVADESSVTWLTLGQKTRKYEAPRIGESWESGELISIVTRATPYHKLWSADGKVLEILPYKNPAGPDSTEQWPPPRPAGDWKPSADLILLDPFSGEMLLYKSSGKWAWNRVQALMHLTKREQAKDPGCCPLIRLDIEDHEGEKNQSAYISPLLIIRAWVSLDGSVREVPEPEPKARR